MTLKSVEHSAGGSRVTSDMQDFIDTINEVEVEDLSSTGMFYTWIKSPKSPQTSILKKLDRAMVNEEFMRQFPMANAVFMPYMVSDHSPVVVRLPSFMAKNINLLDLPISLLRRRSLVLLWQRNRSVMYKVLECINW